MSTPERMSIRFTVVANTTGSAYEVRVSAPAHAAWSHIRECVRRAGHDVPGSLYLGSHLLADDDRFERLENGCVLSPQPAHVQTPELLQLECRHGPQVGLSTAVTRRAVHLGRDESATLRLEDPDVSRRHCEVQLSIGRVLVSDLGSTNGTHVGDQKVSTTAPVELSSTQSLQLGSSLFALHRPTPRRQPPRAGWIEVSRPPTRLSAPRIVRLDRPRKPSRTTHRSLPWLITLLPLVLGVALAWWLQTMMFLAFAVFSPVMMLAQHVSDRRDGRRSKAETAAAHAAAVRRHDRRVREALAGERRIREHAAPPLIEAVHAIAAVGPTLWHRHPAEYGFAQWRLGTGSITSLVCVETEQDEPRNAVLERAPVTVDLVSDRVVGMVGPHQVVRPAVASLLIQFAAWHSPVHLRMAILGDVGANWAPQLQWMPHLQAGDDVCHFLTPDTDEFTQLIRELPFREDRDQPLSTVIVITDTAFLRRSSGLTRVLENPEHHGVAAVCVAQDAADLLDRCHPIVRFTSAVEGTLIGASGTRFLPDLPAQGVARRAFRQSAALRDGAAESVAAALPQSVDLEQVWREAFDQALADHEATLQRWNRSDVGSARAVLGHNGSGPVTVDLVTDGPHVLIAGTTGAGKSELLQTLVASLAAAIPPDAINFILIDYKGGAAFQDCADLPHTVGMVTDLDPHLTERALSSLSAEVRRRELLMRQAGASDLDDYHRNPEAATIPRLVLVIDEFRVLSEELPDFIDGLVRLATVGRSLGIHLVLATQRPAGVVSADIRANVNLRIALRVRDDGDSHDLLEVADAARLSAATPGRALMRTGGSEVQLFQTARVSVPAQAADAVVVGQPAGQRGASHQPSILESLVTVLTGAALEAEKVPPAPPWLPALPDDLRCLPVDRPSVCLSGLNDRGYRFAVVDRPESQDQPVLGWDPERDQHLALIGGPRSGRSNALRQILRTALADPGRVVHAYLLDLDAGLAGVADLPAVGAYVSADEPTRIERVLDWLVAEIRTRRMNTRQQHPRLLVAIDGWDALMDLSDQAHFRILDLLTALLREGTSVDIHVLAAGGRAFMTSRSLPLFAGQIVLAMADRDDIATLGVPRSAIPTHLPPGRGLVLPGGREIQIVQVAPEEPAAPRVMPRRIDAIPHVVKRANLPLDEHGVMLGLGQDGSVHLAASRHTSLVGLICGRPRSGRTNTLRLIAEQLGDRPTCWFSTKTATPLPDSAFRPDDGNELAQWLAANPAGAVLIDDVPTILGSPVEDLLAMHAANCASNGALVLATTTPAEITGNYTGLIGELRRRGTGLLLMPGKHDGEALGVRCPALDRPRPGNGFLVRDGELVELQVALAD